ncbi:MAG: asparagine synthase-related protein [Rhodospirillaceae bacterium]
MSAQDFSTSFQWVPPLDQDCFVWVAPGKDKVLAGRGRSAPYPLFYAWDGTQLHLASQLVALAEQQPGYDPDWVLARAHGFLPVDGSTPYKAIRALRPGEVIAFQPGQPPETVVAPSLPKLGVKRSQSATSEAQAEDLVNQAEDLIATAVGTVVRDSAQPVGIALSGGLDSGIIAGALARTLKPDTPVQAFTVGSEADGDQDAAEFAQAQAVLGLFGQASHHQISAPEAPLPDILTRLIGSLGDVVSAPLSAWWLEAMQRKASDMGCQAVLMGQLGNETISPKGLNQVSQIEPMSAPFLLLRLLREIAAVTETGFARTIYRHYLKQHPAGNVLFRPRTLRAQQALVASYSPVKADQLSHCFAALFARQGKQAFADFRTAKAFQFLNAFERLSLRNSSSDGIPRAPLLLPFANPALREFCWALPVDVLIRHGETRWIARRLYERFTGLPCPAQIPAGSQLGNWHDRFVRDKPTYRSALDEVADVPEVKAFIDLERLSRLLEEITTDPALLTEQDRVNYTVLVRGLALSLFFASAQARTVS